MVRLGGYSYGGCRFSAGSLPFELQQFSLAQTSCLFNVVHLIDPLAWMLLGMPATALRDCLHFLVFQLWQGHILSV